MRILFINYSNYDTCSFYRSAGIAPDLKSKIKIEIDIKSWREEFRWNDLSIYDLIMMQRPYTDMALQMALYAKNMGIKIWTDFDDLTLNVPYDSELYENYGNQARNSIRNIMTISDAISVTTNFLKQEISDLNQNIHVIPNAFNDRIFRKRPTLPKRQKIIAWRGGTTHNADLLAFKDVIVNSIKKYSDWVFPFLGLRPMYYPQLANIRHYGITDPMVYMQNIFNLSPVLLHVPLQDNPFNRSKSNIAFIESAWAGSICLAPDWDEWRNIPGISKYRTDLEYETLLSIIVEAAIKGGQTLRTQADEAWEYVTDNLMQSKVNELRADLVKSLIETK